MLCATRRLLPKALSETWKVASPSPPPPPGDFNVADLLFTFGELHVIIARSTYCSAGYSSAVMSVHVRLDHDPSSPPSSTHAAHAHAHAHAPDLAGTPPAPLSRLRAEGDLDGSKVGQTFIETSSTALNSVWELCRFTGRSKSFCWVSAENLLEDTDG